MVGDSEVEMSVHWEQCGVWELHGAGAEAEVGRTSPLAALGLENVVDCLKP